MSNPKTLLKYRRILLKCSGEALMGKAAFGIEPEVILQVSQTIATAVELGVEIGIVVGGGNFFRGKKLAQAGVTRVTGDYMGMLATVMNALALRDALEQQGLTAAVMSAVAVSEIVEPYSQQKARYCLKRGQPVIFAGGIGNPFFTTDTAACLRAIEISAEIVLKATKVEGIYSEDPLKNSDAILYQSLSYKKVLQKKLEVMDLTAICLCQENNMPIRVFDITRPHAVRDIILGKSIGTIVGANHEG